MSPRPMCPRMKVLWRCVPERCVLPAVDNHNSYSRLDRLSCVQPRATQAAPASNLTHGTYQVYAASGLYSPNLIPITSPHPLERDGLYKDASSKRCIVRELPFVDTSVGDELTLQLIWWILWCLLLPLTLSPSHGISHLFHPGTEGGSELLNSFTSLKGTSQKYLG